MSARRSLRDLWRDYGSRPPVARWTSRVSLVLGAVVGVAGAVGIVGVVAWAAWRLMAWLI